MNSEIHMRQVVLDTETTGIGAEKGHRIIEIGCVELIDRKLTGRHYHQYVNPQRQSDEEAIGVHGITDEFLADKPLFGQVAKAFSEFIDGAELVIHNAPFDVGFMNAEFRRLNMTMTNTFCTVLDTLAMARDMRPGQRNSLDALCKSYGIDNSHRELHGALLDAEILSDVYLMMTGVKESARAKLEQLANVNSQTLSVVRATMAELSAHDEIMNLLDKKSDGAIWKR
jgi:DNA polymerase-3 subunit epsilon